MLDLYPLDERVTEEEKTQLGITEYVDFLNSFSRKQEDFRIMAEPYDYRVPKKGEWCLHMGRAYRATGEEVSIFYILQLTIARHVERWERVSPTPVRKGLVFRGLDNFRSV